MNETCLAGVRNLIKLIKALEVRSGLEIMSDEL